MNRIANELIEITGATIYTNVIFEGNHYDPNDNAINLNVLNDTVLGVFAKYLTKRPNLKNFALYHELAHAFVNKFDLSNNRKVVAVFGKLDPEDAPGLLEMLITSLNNKDSEYLTPYAEASPEEDFADTFAFLLVYRLQIPNEIKDKTLLRKLLCVKELIQDALKRR